MPKQIMIMAVVEDNPELSFEQDDQELLRLIQDVLVHKHDVCIIVEDVTTTQEDYDWKTANGVVDEDESEESSVNEGGFIGYPSDLAAFRED